ncbi:MAG: hypothetical protein VYC42_07490, partial [Pseudomonadota bacterium]|nr:hypothetical protein [Pseudomonadota bacterium]
PTPTPLPTPSQEEVDEIDTVLNLATQPKDPPKKPVDENGETADRIDILETSYELGELSCNQL